MSRAYSILLLFLLTVSTYADVVYQDNILYIDGGGGYVRAVETADKTYSLTATANSGYDFISWSDGVTTNPRTVTLTGDSTLWAVFARTTFPRGTVDVTITSSTYPMTFDLTANGSAFSGWSNGQSSSTISYTEGQEVGCVVRPIFPAMTSQAVFQQGTGGTLAGVDNGNDTYTLTATPVAPEYSFVCWEDGTTTNPRTLTLSIGQVNGAVFGRTVFPNATVDISLTSWASQTYSLTASSSYFVGWSNGKSTATISYTDGEEVGCVVRPICPTLSFQSVFQQGTGGFLGGSDNDNGTYTLTATPVAPEYSFVCWEDGTTTNPRTLTPSIGQVNGAVFGRTVFPNATVDISLTSWASQTYSLTANSSYFVGWSNGLSSSTISYTDGQEIACVVRPICPTILSQAVYQQCSGGTLGGSDNDNGTFTLTATPVAPEYSFVCWEDGTTTNPRTLTPVLGQAKGAVFGRTNFPYGTIDIGIKSWKNQTFIVTASECNFVGWSNGVASRTINSYTEKQEKQCIVRPVFMKIRPIIDTVDGGTVAVTRNPECNSFSLRVRPSFGYAFTKWENDLTSTTRDVSFTTDTFKATFTQMPDLGSKVSEWGHSSLLLDLLSNTHSVATGRYRGDITAPVSLAANMVDVGLYHIPTVSLVNHGGDTILFYFYDSNGDVIGFGFDTIPFIPASGYQTTASWNASKCALGKLVVPDGSVLTLSSDLSFKQADILGGGKLVIPTAKTLTVDSMIVHSGSVEAGVYQYTYPQMAIQGTLSTPTGLVYYDYLLNKKQQYNLAVPAPVTRSAITASDGSSITYKVAAFDGLARANTGAGWGYTETATLGRGIGYTTFATPHKVTPEGGSATRRQYIRMRLPMLLGTDYTEEEHSVAVTAFAAEKANDAGWNLVANPYFTDYHGILALDETEQTYVVIPNDDGTSYENLLTSNATLQAFHAFFIQAETTGNLFFALGNRRMNAPAQMSESSSDWRTGITFSVASAPKPSDKVGLLIGDRYTDEYEYNADLTKWMNTNINMYAIVGNARLSYAAVSEHIAKNVIPLGYKVTQKGEYRIAIDADYDNDRMSALLLEDYQTGVITNLLENSYSFTTAAQTNDTRFALYIVPKNTLPTDIDRLYSPENNVHVKRIEDGILYIYHNGVKYSAQGQVVANKY